MRPQKPTTLNFSYVKIILPILCMVFIFSCNNEKSGSPEKADSTGKSQITATPEKVASATLEDFPVLCFDKATLENYFAKQPSQPAVKKLVFIFNINESENFNPSLNVYRAKQTNRAYIKGAPEGFILARTIKTEKISGDFLLGNLEMSKDYYDNTVKKGAGYATANGLFFYPKKDGNNNVYYELHWGDCNNPPPDVFKMAPPPPPAGAVNPSPPADPE